MSILGAYLTVLIGQTLPTPAPPDILGAIQSVEVQHGDEGRSGFQINLAMGRSGLMSLTDYPLLQHETLRPFNRVILSVLLGARTHVLMDGIITHHQFTPSNTPGAATLTVIGEDLGVLMDMEARKAPLQALSDSALARWIITRGYARYGIVPEVYASPDESPPAKDQPPPFQDTTDLRYLRRLAARYGFVNYVYSTPIPGVNKSYWGPRIRAGVPQPALSVNLGPNTNVQDIRFSYNALTPIQVRGGVQDAGTDQVHEFTATRPSGPSLSATSALASQSRVRETRLGPASGLTYAQARSRANGMVAQALDRTVQAEGSLDTLRYGAVLETRRLVGVRGAGDTYDGTYYVRGVTHSLTLGAYEQSFSLLRQGLGAASPVVLP